MNHLQAPKKQTQTNPIKACPERIYTELRRSSRMGQLPVPTRRVSPVPLFRVPYTLRGFTLWGAFLPLLQDSYILYPLQGTKN